MVYWAEANDRSGTIRDQSQIQAASGCVPGVQVLTLLDEYAFVGTYPVITVRWVAIHALAVPTLVFLGSISAMQFM